MKTIKHPADSRGKANHGWLKSAHTFSFAHYHDPSRERFGLLRVLNDDEVSGGEGFGTHPHRDMEIVSIPLEGALLHRDSMGQESVIRPGDVQVMTAGSGVTHSEFNASKEETVIFLQIWIFPKERNLVPRYSEKNFSAALQKGGLVTLVSPHDSEALQIQQEASFHRLKLSAGEAFHYKITKEGQGVYAFMIDGEATIDNEQMHRRDGLGIWEASSVEIKAQQNMDLLLIEVPMN
jgi:redox-sensitive bicupin YhaK (pirin superfamily)